MLKALAFAATLVAVATNAAAAPPPAPVVFFDIAGPNAAAQTTFYRDVFGWQTGPGGALSVPTLGSSLAGALRQDPTNKIIYLGVDDVTAALTEVVSHGGKVVAPRFAVKGVVILGLFTDPAGNSMGLVEMRNGKPVVP